MRTATEQDFNKNFHEMRSRVQSASSTQRRSIDQTGKMQFRQAAMTSIYKSIKNNDISFVLGTTKASTQGFLPSLPKTTDDAIDFIRESEELVAEEDRLTALTEGIFKEEERLKEEADQTEYLTKEAEWTKKSYQHIRRRLKKDTIAYQLKQQALENEIESIKRCLTHAENHSTTSKQYSSNATKILGQMIRNVETEFKERETKLVGFKNQFLMWEDNEKKKITRSEKGKEIAEHAIYDKDPLEKKLRQLLLTHRLVSALLKSKMDREMKKFSLVEESFARIKLATGQTEMKNIVQKFLKREETYGELLGQIASHEKKIEMIRKRNEQLEDKQTQLKAELIQMEMQLAQKKNKGGNQERHDFLKKIEAVEESRKLSELMYEKLFQFCTHTLDQLDKVNCKENKIPHHKKLQREQLIEVFNLMYEKIMDELNQPTTQDVEAVLADLTAIPIERETNDDSYRKRNVRVKPKLNSAAENRSQSAHSHDSSNTSKNTPSLSQQESESDNEEVDENIEIDYFDMLRGERKMEDQQVLKKVRQEREREAIKKMIPPSP